MAQRMVSPLIGLWSADYMYGPGAQSDEVLIFKPDGTGRFEFINFRLWSADVFHWHVSSDNLITLQGFKQLQVDETETYVREVASPFQFTNIAFHIATEQTLSGKIMPVLCVQLYPTVSNHYGFVRADLTGFEEPDFDLE
jgi:hypothetical protein